MNKMNLTKKNLKEGFFSPFQCYSFGTLLQLNYFKVWILKRKHFEGLFKEVLVF